MTTTAAAPLRRSRPDLPDASVAPDLAQLGGGILAALGFLFERSRPDGHWCGELRSNPTVTAEYVLMRQALGLSLADEGAGLRRWLLGEQNPDGSYGLGVGYPGDVSTTAEVYLALRLLGVEASEPAMARARAFVLAQGGIARVRVFTRIFFAMFGLFPWAAVPQLPAEFILLPAWCPINIYKLASWARGTMVPLLLILHHRPVYALPNGRRADNDYLDALWCDPARKHVPYAPTAWALLRAHGPGWKALFGALDALMTRLGGLRGSPLRSVARRRCVRWILERQEASGDWAGIFPPMLNNLLALPLEGYGLDSEPMRLGLEAMARFAWEDGGGRRVQACVSPVWDTVLTAIALRDAGVPASDPRLQRAVDWIRERQLSGPEGDWRVYRPRLQAGGWAFEYDNAWYPDVDDTAAVLLALLKQDPTCLGTDVAQRGIGWILGMQNRDGGWGAFDVDNDALFLNDIPFADMGALCDPSTADVTGRIIEAFGLALQCNANHALSAALEANVRAACRRALAFLRRAQERSGAWWGRWGVNYLYGTSNVLCGLAALNDPSAADMRERGAVWVLSAQRDDGGWGESLHTYDDPGLAGVGDATASQTAWALMALLSVLPPEHPGIARGVAWLLAHQTERTAGGATWPEPQTTATGFPGHFYVRYDMYRHHFPLMALGRYASALGASQDVQLRQLGGAQDIAR
jgi:squalene-hopene/tetraprenyl-beta-curcumene cyclase